MSLLGLDVGTGGCKAAAFAAEGHMLGAAYREYPTLHPRAGEAELDSRHVWQCVKEVLAAVAAQTPRDPIAALCVSAMGEAATPVSRDRRILANCILSSDARGASYVETLRRQLGAERFYRINPNVLSVNYTLPKLLWIRDNQPELYAAAETFLLWDGLVAFMLGCDPFVSCSHANRTLLFDIRKEDWSDELLRLSGVERGKLPPCLPGGTVAGTVSRAVADELGLPHGVKVVVGGHDQCCNALGAGIARAGKAVDGIGTFECITPVYDRIPDAETMLRNGLNVEHHVLPGLYVSFLYNQAGSLVRWFRDTFARDCAASADAYARLGAEMPPEPTRLFVLPYFELTGSPGFVGNASGVIVGLRPDTARGDILKAIMESVTFYFVESLQALREVGIDTSEFIATGGGARSDAWLQIKADIFGVPFVRLRYTECGLLGAAILAGVAAHAFRSPEEGIARFVQRERVFEPDARRHTIYRDRTAKYRDLFPLMKDYLATLP